MVRTACGHTVKREDACSFEGKAGPFLVCRWCCRYCTGHPGRGQSGGTWEWVG